MSQTPPPEPPGDKLSTEQCAHYGVPPGAVWRRFVETETTSAIPNCGMKAASRRTEEALAECHDMLARWEAWKVAHADGTRAG